jgi:lipoprotein NlpD
LQFVSPAEGELIGGFSETGTQKGIEIASDFGAPVVASAAGEVVYSGTGLRGYGKLVLIKHNSSYITAYAHNSKLLVKQGQTVEQGEQIAEMGNTDTNRVELYFEVRRCGKAVDPSKYLPLN